MLNKFGPSGNGEAQLQYLDGDFRVVSPGTYVKCAVTEIRIPLDELKYWSVDRQEAYAVPTAVLFAEFSGIVKAVVVMLVGASFTLVTVMVKTCSTNAVLQRHYPGALKLSEQ